MSDQGFTLRIVSPRLNIVAGPEECTTRAGDHCLYMESKHGGAAYLCQLFRAYLYPTKSEDGADVVPRCHECLDMEVGLPE